MANIFVSVILIIENLFRIYNITTFLMSILIEMPDSPEPHPSEQSQFQLQTQVTSLLHHPEFNVTVILARHDSPIEIILGIPRGPLAFVRDTRWQLQLIGQRLKIIVAALDCSGLNFTRAQSQRMKLQLMILLKTVNSKLPIEEEYYVEPDTGILRYSFSITWKDYIDKLGKVDSLKKLFRYILHQLNLHAELILFCQPESRQTLPGQQFYHGHPDIETVNRFRFLMRNTVRFRQAAINYFDNLIELKQHLRTNPVDFEAKSELDQARLLFQSNIRAFDQLRAGLDTSEKSMQKLASCLKHNIKNAKGEESNPPQGNIVSGIRVVKSGDFRNISKEGAHSDIMSGKYIYQQFKSINLETVQNNSVWLNGKQNKGELVFKKCKVQESTSINSFMNQICLLNHLRDNKSSYIAKYFLQVKLMADRNQKDIIYMRPYFQNLHSLLKKCKTLSFSERLSLAYRISKGFCFLGHRSVLHRDLKPNNIMVDQNINPFIIDFGSCAPIYRATNFQVRDNRLLTTRTFHVYYHELPEQYSYLQSKFTRQEYNRHPLFDVYSFGRVLSFLFFNTIMPPAPDEAQKYPYPQLLRNILYLISLCLQLDPDERPTFAEMASFLGALGQYLHALPQHLQSKYRSFSQPKPIIASQL